MVKCVFQNLDLFKAKPTKGKADTKAKPTDTKAKPTDTKAKPTN